MKCRMYDYQKTALNWVLDKPRCGLFLDMGLGKSLITLTAVQELIDCCEISKVLVVAPKKVAETTWTDEARKWDHLHLKVEKVMGTEKQRVMALARTADVYVTGRDNFTWLVAKYGGSLPFDMVVIDELTSFKNPKSQRFKAMKIVVPAMSRIVGLTGTPAPNGLMDLWAQMYCIDQGASLGKSITKYRETYFESYRRNNIVIRCDIRKGCESIIKDKISGICLSMQARDYLQLPPLIIHKTIIELSEKTIAAYTKFERERVLEFQREHTEEPANILANSAAGLMNKLSQFSNGAVYDDQKNVYKVHDEKIEKLKEIVEGANGESVLVFYQFKHDIPRIAETLKGYRVSVYDGESDLEKWNSGKIDVLLAHPSSTAYGLNMQRGGRYIIWFGTGWNLELYQQANARLHRQGQEKPVIVYNLVCKGTVDERAEAAISDKKRQQQALLDSLSYLLEKYKKNY